MTPERSRIYIVSVPESKDNAKPTPVTEPVEVSKGSDKLLQKIQKILVEQIFSLLEEIMLFLVEQKNYCSEPQFYAIMIS